MSKFHNPYHERMVQLWAEAIAYFDQGDITPEEKKLPIGISKSKWQYHLQTNNILKETHQIILKCGLKDDGIVLPTLVRAKWQEDDHPIGHITKFVETSEYADHLAARTTNSIITYLGEKCGKSDEASEIILQDIGGEDRLLMVTAIRDDINDVSIPENRVWLETMNAIISAEWQRTSIYEIISSFSTHASIFYMLAQMEDEMLKIINPAVPGEFDIPIIHKRNMDFGWAMLKHLESVTQPII